MKTARVMIILLPLIIMAMLWSDMFGYSGNQQVTTLPDDRNYYRVAETTIDDLPSMNKYALMSHPGVEKIVSMSAYTSREEETDSTPCISADGTNICQYDGCIVASNDYPFNTVIFIEGFGECVVKDRMASRYTGTGNMDLYFGKDLEGAVEFGRQDMKIKITS